MGKTVPVVLSGHGHRGEQLTGSLDLRDAAMYEADFVARETKSSVLPSSASVRKLKKYCNKRIPAWSDLEMHAALVFVDDSVQIVDVVNNQHAGW
jgi:hypothetical protein